MAGKKRTWGSETARSEFVAAVLKVLNSCSGKRPKGVTEDSTLESLGLDTSDATDIAEELEESFPISVAVNDVVDCATVGAVVDVVVAKVKERDGDEEQIDDRAAYEEDD